MSELTKEMRNFIYKEALILLKKDGVRSHDFACDGHTGICDYLRLIQKDSVEFQKKFNPRGVVHPPNRFKEMRRFMPLHIKTAISPFDPAWWSFDEKGFKKRISVLERCIELTS